MGIYSGVMEEITWYTGLSPAAFFTIAALMVVVYRTVSAMFVSPEDFNKPPVASISINDNNSSFLNGVLGQTTTTTNHQQSLQLGDMTEKELRAYNGSDPNKPLLISVKGQIYDVSSSRMFYGPGGPYAMFTGKEASRALALLSFKPQDINGNLEDLGPDELQVLEDWEDKFIEKYPKVGQLVAESTTPKPAQSGEEIENRKID
ncbi:Cytochrome b5-like heme/steroid binding domain containing protein [Trema orientale]|uniref:Cytochrome b5-like heme/steroid binding domain containing protein n=1 Tax=Trema orientale TaxID=63057 RepID=A0A2P5EZR7_TREOI|nr:Cytochrome b5-like heme/steroid binding domain containing protein [Trema orientale]